MSPVTHTVLSQTCSNGEKIPRFLPRWCFPDGQIVDTSMRWSKSRVSGRETVDIHVWANNHGQPPSPTSQTQTHECLSVCKFVAGSRSSTLVVAREERTKSKIEESPPSSHQTRFSLRINKNQMDNVVTKFYLHWLPFCLPPTLFNLLDKLPNFQYTKTMP